MSMIFWMFDLWYYYCMRHLFNKNFFKFAGGFVGIVSVAIFSILVLGAYEAGVDTPVDNEQLIVE